MRGYGHPVRLRKDQCGRALVPHQISVLDPRSHREVHVYEQLSMQALGFLSRARFEVSRVAWVNQRERGRRANPVPVSHAAFDGVSLWTLLRAMAGSAFLRAFLAIP